MKKSKFLSFLLALSLSSAAFTGCGEKEVQEDNLVIYGYEEDKSEYVMERSEERRVGKECRL